MNHHEGDLHFAAHQGLHKLFREVGNILLRLQIMEACIAAMERRLRGGIDGRLTVLEAQSAALTSSDVVRRVADLETTALSATDYARLQVLEVRINTVEADLEHRIVVLESRMENVMARLDGHDLGFATLSLDEKGKAALARMMRLGEKGRPIVPGEEGTSES